MIWKTLYPSEIEHFAHVPFLAEASLRRATAPGERTWPASRGSGRAEQQSIHAWECIRISTEQPNGRIWLNFGKKQGATDGKSHVHPRELFGISGGAILALPIHESSIRLLRPRNWSDCVPVGTRPRMPLAMGENSILSTNRNTFVNPARCQQLRRHVPRRVPACSSTLSAVSSSSVGGPPIRDVCARFVSHWDVTRLPTAGRRTAGSGQLAHRGR